MTLQDLAKHLRISKDYIHRLVSKSGEWFDMPRTTEIRQIIRKDGKRGGVKCYKFNIEEVYAYFKKKFGK
jgi:hypothetical protein